MANPASPPLSPGQGFWLSIWPFLIMGGLLGGAMLIDGPSTVLVGLTGLDGTPRAVTGGVTLAGLMVVGLLLARAASPLTRFLGTALASGCLGLQCGHALAAFDGPVQRFLDRLSLEAFAALAMGAIVLFLAAAIWLISRNKERARLAGIPSSSNDLATYRTGSLVYASEGTALIAAALLSATGGGGVAAAVLGMALAAAAWGNWRCWKAMDEFNQKLWSDSMHLGANVWLAVILVWFAIDAVAGIGLPGLLGTVTLFFALYIGASILVMARRAPHLLVPVRPEDEA
jgi:hypothetical protein